MLSWVKPIAFAGCDYLGLARDPRVIEAARRALESDGLSAGASPATTGRRAVHDDLERELAAFVGAEAAALLPSGALASLALAQALAATDARAPVWVDPRAHASLTTSARGAGLRVVRAIDDARHLFVDGVYPSRGEAPDLVALRARIAERGGGGVLVVDDAHGLGVRGPEGRGSVAAAELAPNASPDPSLALVLTFTKALGAGGAAVAGSAALVARVRESTAYVGSTALAPALAAGTRAALAIVRGEPERLARLRSHVATLARALADAGVAVPDLGFPILAVPPGADDGSDDGSDNGSGADPGALRDALAAEGFDVPVVRYPDGVAPNRPDGGPSGYLRLALSAAHSSEEVARLAGTLARLLR